VGFYQDPASDYGRLSSELFRAVRLVVDTGIHSKGWNRDQVVEFKLGQLKFRELRDRARRPTDLMGLSPLTPTHNARAECGGARRRAANRRSSDDGDVWNGILSTGRSSESRVLSIHDLFRMPFLARIMKP
jgi:hypothetical protein